MYTLSWHQGGSRLVHQGHNRRERHALGHKSEIDSTRTKNNVVLVDIPMQQAYENLFGEAVAEYNRKTRASRQIQDYYKAVQRAGKQPAYEVIVQVGSKAEGTPQKAVQALKRYVTEWTIRNPNLALIGAYIHMDESGATHLHVDYIPIAKCSRGMRVQNSLTRALAAQGFKTKSARDTAQIQWEQSERDSMRTICADLGIQLYTQGKGRTQHYTVGEYKDRQDRIKAAEASLTAVKQQETEIITTLDLAYQQMAQAENANKQRQAEAYKKYITTLQKADALQKKLEKGKTELDVLQCKAFSLKQDTQEKQKQITALDKEIKRMGTEYKTAYNMALQEKAIAVLRADADGQGWWAWAVDTAAQQGDLQTYTEYAQQQEQQEQDYEYSLD